MTTRSLPLSVGSWLAKCCICLRGRTVLLDADAAKFYGISLRRLREVVTQNCADWPDDFFFALNVGEHPRVARQRRGEPVLAFSPEGVVMIAFSLESPRARDTQLQVVRFAVRQRQFWRLVNSLQQHLDATDDISTLTTLLDHMATDTE